MNYVNNYEKHSLYEYFKFLEQCVFSNLANYLPLIPMYYKDCSTETNIPNFLFPFTFRDINSIS